jgi:hypothetical protein
MADAQQEPAVLTAQDRPPHGSQFPCIPNHRGDAGLSSQGNTVRVYGVKEVPDGPGVSPASEQADSRI